MKQVTEESGLDFDLLILKVDQFNSGFMKKEFSQLPILFSDHNGTNIFKDVVNSINAEKTEKSNFFYLFYRRKNNGKNRVTLDVQQLAQRFTELANKKI
jgi:hypothetical protein